MNIDRIIEHYLYLRDVKKKEIEARHKEELRPIKEDMEAIEAALQAHLDKQGLDSLSAKGVGTAYRSITTSATVSDRAQWIEAVIQQGAWDLIEARANKTALMEHYDGEFPGVTVNQRVRINVRKS